MDALTALSLRCGDICLILCDLQMPQMDGSAPHTTAEPASAAIARARLLIEAHGGTLDVGIGADGLKAARVRLPADRAVSA